MDLAANLSQLRRRIEAACLRAGRDPSQVTILAVSKGQMPDAIERAAREGLRLFGENRVQELKAKVEQCSSSLSWHMIGHLQSNKAREAVALSEMIESVDSFSLAREIDKWSEKMSKIMPVLLEVNVAGENSKFGYRPEKLVEEIQELSGLKRISIAGLMTIAPWTNDPEKVRPVFRKLKELKKQCEDLQQKELPHLSMGMSGDFEVAIEEGSTLIRIGTALFGPRPTLRERRTAASSPEEGP